MSSLRLYRFFDNDGNIKYFYAEDIYIKSENKDLEEFSADLVSTLEALKSAIRHYTSVVIAQDIAARDLLTKLVAGSIVWVEDATGDDTVTSGGAAYLVKVINGVRTWIKLTESESLDITIDWSHLNGTPMSSPEEIDDAVYQRHSHQNKAILDDVESYKDYLSFNSKVLSGTTGIDIRESEDSNNGFKSKVCISVEAVES